MESKFVHLRLHTEFSLSDGIVTLPDMMQRAAACKMPALAITDLNNLYATVKFYQKALDAGIKPIIGVDMRIAHPTKPNATHRLTLLCQNTTGYKNLLKLVSRSFLEGQGSGVAVAQKEWLETLSEGLIALSGAQDGDIGEAILAQDTSATENLVSYWQTLFPGRFYIELSRVGKREERDYIPAAVQLASQFNLPVIATNDVRFINKEDFEAHEARVCIQEGYVLNDPNRPRHYTDQQYFRSPDEMARLFADIPQAIENTFELAKRCNVTFTLGVSSLPHFEVPAPYTTDEYIAVAARAGLDERLKTILDSNAADYAEKRKPYDDRLERELGVIVKMGFAGYFLIVADFTKWAKENEVPVGPGRGSGPGSLVAYTLNITDLDPLAFDLLFERFLNPERVSMPDFDIDFCMEGRDRVIEYVMKKHGEESVSQIITYGTMAAKAVVRDVGRVLALGYGFVDKIAKLIPFELGITLDKALAQEPLLRERYEQEEDVRTLIDLALKLEGITRNVGKHAGGIVIAPGKLTDFVPVYCENGEDATPVTQFDKDDVEAVGLVKFDFLGLKTLTIIDRALRIINHAKPDDKINIGLIPLNDAPTYKLLKACKSCAVFQLESHGMRDLIKRLQPDCFEDLIALVALFRPGPLQSGMVDDFINRKHGRAKVSYPHPVLEPILRPTYGVIVYQEQVMQIAQSLAGYTLGAADILRRAMGKKKPEEMHKQREIFCQGATERGVDVELANSIFDLMEKFAGYGFNKSHSAAYALVAYQTAWLKTHYTAAFMAAVLSSDMDKTDKILILRKECDLFGIKVLAPDINSSEYFFKVVDDHHLMYGLGAIKGMGEGAIENIVESRKLKGPYKNLFDFCERVDLRKVNRRALEALIKSGSFDQFETDRAILMASVNKALQHAEQALHNQTYGQHDLLAAMNEVEAPSYVHAQPCREDVKLQGEKETLGFYLSGHPLDQYAEELANFTTCRIAELHPAMNKNAAVAGIIANIRTRQTKRGDRFAIFTIDDGTAQMEVVCFSECYQKYRHLIVEDGQVIVEGEVSIDDFNNSTRIMCRDLSTFDEAREKNVKCLQLHLPNFDELDMGQLTTLINQHRGGNCPIVIRQTQDDVVVDIRLGKTWMVKPTIQFASAVEAALAIDKVEFIYH